MRNGLENPLMDKEQEEAFEWTVDEALSVFDEANAQRAWVARQQAREWGYQKAT